MGRARACASQSPGGYLTRPAEQPVDLIEVMDEHERCDAAGQPNVGEPAAPVRGRLQAARADDPGPAELTARSVTVEFAVTGPEAEDEADHQHAAAFAARLR